MNTKHKIVSSATLKKKILSLRKQGKEIAFTNGCFDILHFGHVSYLEAAKKDSRILIIGLNSDSSVRKLKGPKRPIVSENQRAAVLAALECVDFVTIFNEETPLKVIEAIKPDVLIKGADWKGKDVVGAASVKSHGGKVEFITYVDGLSSTNIIKTISERCAK